jgi:hypothetical protein
MAMLFFTYVTSTSMGVVNNMKFFNFFPLDDDDDGSVVQDSIEITQVISSGIWILLTNKLL